MPLLNTDCKTRIKQEIAKGLSAIKVDSDQYLDTLTCLEIFSAENVIPNHGQLHEKLINFIGESPLFDFVYQTLAKELQEDHAYNSERSGIPLSEFPIYNDLDATASRIIDLFDSLPWNYLISLELPKAIGQCFAQTDIDFELSPSLKVSSVKPQYSSLYPLQSGIARRDDRLFGRTSLLLGPVVGEWKQETGYLHINAEGFIGIYGTSNPVILSIEIIKSFIGLSLAVYLIKKKINYSKPSLGFSLPKSWLIIHEKSDDVWRMFSTIQLQTELTETLDKFEYDDRGGRVKPEKMKYWILDRLKFISLPFKNKDKGKKILLAAEWLFDSYVGSNELLSFLQTTVSMEILLGEESKTDVIGIGEIIRNRCAYLIGKSHTEREAILKDFNKIYDVRSKIVHRGKSRLNANEKSLFNKLQWLCKSVIYAELNLLEQDQKNSAKGKKEG